MAKLDALRQLSQFPGTLLTVLEDFEARLQAQEANAPMLAELKSGWEDHKAEMAERAAREKAAPAPTPISAVPPASAPAAAADTGKTADTADKKKAGS